MRTTWLPYTDRLPIDRRQAFVDQAVAQYLRARPVDDRGCTHMKMVRLEVEAVAT
jgi:trans-aconitate 2-methyltransferase